jgi:hypothetical protein
MIFLSYDAPSAPIVVIETGFGTSVLDRFTELSPNTSAPGTPGLVQGGAPGRGAGFD